MKAWELIATLEGADPEAEVVVRDRGVNFLVDDAVIEPPADRSSRVVLVVNG